ncbi:MAG: outer membrane beta-barrel protein [Hydrogenophaga sp.]|uniref:outer membrane protein n=1 Tax=Hydrogenophaga sp. TaxID=1904254 RepID=UPI0027559160|nr:outer membrane beta-barrel protein [Hydrogenophaga sp.]MDP3832917.1 outer membrane beta-barrel protein [Hydrogenophaga sp.]MDZ4400789.1 outer membrane beta-barrel protein [Hydrogenophaga sp.]
MVFRTCWMVGGLVFAGASGAGEMDWRGSYLGIHGGHTSAHTRLSTTTKFVDSGYDLAAGTYFAASSVDAIAASGRGGLSPSADSAGLSWGRNWQAGPLVIGLEADLGSMKLRATRSAGSVYPCCAPFSYEVRQSIETDWLVTARGRIGYAFNRSLLYATAGLALARVNVDARFTDNDPDARASTTLSTSQWGWALGLGYEHGLEDRWSFKAEVLNLDLGRASSTSNNLETSRGVFPAAPFTTRVRLRASQVRVGLNKRW